MPSKEAIGEYTLYLIYALSVIVGLPIALVVFIFKPFKSAELLARISEFLFVAATSGAVILVLLTMSSLVLLLSFLIKLALRTVI